MWYFLLVAAIPANVILLGVYVTGSINCIKACNEDDNSIVCNQSLILISDVTNWMLEKNHAAFENMKRDCMGKESCDPSNVCGAEHKQALVVHYLCVDANHIRSMSCNGHVLKMRGSSGYIQSPGYPVVTTEYVPCKWQIEPPNDNVVVLSLHDIAVSSSGGMENCDGGLVVSGRSCDGLSSVFVRRSLCGGDNLTSLVRCGKVEIELSPSYRVYPLRFWLSFHVHSKNQASSFQASLLPCSGWIYDMDTEIRHGVKDIINIDSTQIPIVNIGETNTEVLIIMLSIISGISAVLLVILIVVCVRCRLLQASHSESVFSDPSPGLQAHYKYISSLESEKTRPQLADGYCEVADALPFTQRGETPTSPAYAEVEQFAHLRKALWSSSSEDGLRGSKPVPGDVTPGDNEFKNIGASSETAKPKRGVLGRRKGEKDKHGDKDKKLENRISIGPKIIPVKKQTSPSSAAESPQSTSSTQACSPDDACPTYEQVGEISRAPVYSVPDHKSPISSKNPHSGTHYTEVLDNNTSFENYTQTLGRKKHNAHHFTENSSGAHLHALTPEELKAPKKPPRLSISTSSDFSKGSATLPSKNSRAFFQASGKKNIHASKDVPQTGIVKNGIKKFEQCSS